MDLHWPKWIALDCTLNPQCPTDGCAPRSATKFQQNNLVKIKQMCFIVQRLRTSNTMGPSDLWRIHFRTVGAATANQKCLSEASMPPSDMNCSLSYFEMLWIESRPFSIRTMQTSPPYDGVAIAIRNSFRNWIYYARQITSRASESWKYAWFHSVPWANSNNCFRLAACIYNDGIHSWENEIFPWLWQWPERKKNGGIDYKTLEEGWKHLSIWRLKLGLQEEYSIVIQSRVSQPPISVPIPWTSKYILQTA